MQDFDRMVRVAGVQRSAAIGMALGEALGNAWLAMAAAIGGAKASPVPRTDKTVPAR